MTGSKQARAELANETPLTALTNASDDLSGN